MAKPLDPTARVRHTIAVVVFLVIATPSRKHASRPNPKARENKLNIYQQHFTGSTLLLLRNS